MAVPSQLLILAKSKFSRHRLTKLKVKVTLRLTVGQSLSLGVMTRYLLLFHSYGLVFGGQLL
jgi:hypothetical protein